jgi:SAM-dependent methyltransferase
VHSPPTPAEAAGRPPSAVDLLHSATDRAGLSPRDWVTSALGGLGEPVAELTGIPGHPSAQIRLRRWAGPDGGDADGGDADGGDRCRDRDGGVVCDADRLPVRTNGLAAVGAVMCLPSVGPLNALFGELRRVLRPTGTLIALVPSRPTGPLGAPAAWRAVNRALRGHPGFRHEVARDHLAWLFAAADFALMADQRRTFWLPVPDPPHAVAAVAGLVPAGVWPPDLEPERLRRAEALLVGHARPGRRLPVPVRLLVGRR